MYCIATMLWPFAQKFWFAVAYGQIVSAEPRIVL
ncbi:hypothetical protein IST455A_02142 [Burkholderia multivorans]|nr:hypothetical protein [Burkholderia multivorans]MDR8806433.1 hypothetical protein [Burkholderia multivorans]CAB5286612.1 hypothetical protein IST495A_04480 [Burkholderia multivorans]CAB5291072.1 hypothetical protein IST419_02259 [Burkholderia multivorans]CAB5297703.1 hypothetical protein IST453_02331 [Burkholderia multivorans]